MAAYKLRTASRVHQKASFHLPSQRSGTARFTVLPLSLPLLFHRSHSHAHSRRALMAALVPVVLVLMMIGASDAAWCVCRSDVGDPYLQKSLDYACGAGADCSPILQNGGCYNPNTVRSHCSYAANSYYQRNGQAATACNFSGTATLTTTDPSYTGCTFPSSPSAAGTSSTPSTTSTGTTMPGFSPPNGVLGAGLGPSSSLSTDSSHGGFLLNGSLLAVICSGMMMIIALLV